MPTLDRLTKTAFEVMAHLVAPRNAMARAEFLKTACRQELARRRAEKARKKSPKCRR